MEGMEKQSLCGDVTTDLMATTKDVKVPAVVTSGLLTLLTIVPHP